MSIVKELIEQGRLDGNPALPKYPSAQIYYQLRKKELKELQQVVEKSTVTWEEYETDMMSHWPQTSAPEITRKIIRRELKQR